MFDDLESKFAQFDSVKPVELGYRGAIDCALTVVDNLCDRLRHDSGFSDKLAEIYDEGAFDIGWSDHLIKVGSIVPDSTASRFAKAMDVLGGIGQLWTSKNMPAFNRPSTLGQAIVLGTLGTLGGRAIGGILDRTIGTENVSFKRLGTLLGAGVGLAPAIVGGTLNAFSGKPVLTSSFFESPMYDSPEGEKTREEIQKIIAESGTDFSRPPPAQVNKVAGLINVDEFQSLVWSNPHVAAYLPVSTRAAASGLVFGASNLPEKPRNSPFVTPMDVARMAVGMGSGAASGWLVGQTLGAAMGLSKPLKDKFIQTGAMAGLIKNVVPLAFGAR